MKDNPLLKNAEQLAVNIESQGGDHMFNQMLETAKDKLTTVNEIADGLPAPQVTVVLTNNDNIYVTVNDVDGSICQKLKQNKDTTVVKILTMWKDGSIDLPSYSLRKALIKMDNKNCDASVLLQGKSQYLIKKLTEVMG